MRGHSDIIFARRLRAFRRQARVPQRELAAQMTAAQHKMLPSTISAIETGHRLVTIGEAVQFAAALGIPLLALVTDVAPHNLIEAQLAVPAVPQEAARRPRTRTRSALPPATGRTSKWGPRSGAPPGCSARRVDKAVAQRAPNGVRAAAPPPGRGGNRNRLTHQCPERGKQSPSREVATWR